MTRRTFLGGCVLLIAAVAGCYTGGGTAPQSRARNRATTDSATSVDGTEPAVVLTGMPCSVAGVLAASCVSCHGDVLAGGAPNRMTTYEDLAAPSRTDPARSVAEVSVDLMRGSALPMPPTGDAVSEKDIAGFASWIAAGLKEDSCTQVVDPAQYDTPTVCSSNSTWTNGDRRSVLMRPGYACIECHDRDRGPSYTAAGTVYPTAHEPDDCNGTKGAGIQIVITDATGTTFTQTANAAGNFYFDTRRNAIKTPYRAKVVSGSKTREMIAPQTDGDCNTCHNEIGKEKAPGRVMAP